MTNDDSANEDKQNPSRISWHIVFSLCVLVIGMFISSNSNQGVKIECEPVKEPVIEKKPTYWVYSQSSNVDSESGILKHVHLVLKRLGFVKGTNESEWDLLWSHDYPFRLLYPQFNSLKRHQLINHFPGTGYITNKVDFATTDIEYIPKAFRIPEDSTKLLEYATEKPGTLFVHKDNQHRGVVLKNISEIDLKAEGNFVQEYVMKPFLVDGHKFDIGVYTILTSVDPLRVYIYKGDVLFRYCPNKYYPFDPADIDKYVIGDDYLPTWEVPSLSQYYTAMGYGMRDSFDAYVRSQGKDPSIIWTQIDDFIGKMFLKKEDLIALAVKNYQRGSNFFELMRFDFVIDEDLKLYALEANMSPNLSSAHYPPNQLLYEQVIYSLFSLVGVGKYTHSHSLAERNDGEARMRVTDKNIAVWSEHCSTETCRVGCDGICGTCRHCLTPKLRQMFTQTVNEQLNRNDCKRIYPPPMEQGGKADYPNTLSVNNRLMFTWLQGKCNNDITWCN